MSSACWMRVAASCERVLVDPEREDEARDDGTWGAGHEDDESDPTEGGAAAAVPELTGVGLEAPEHGVRVDHNGTTRVASDVDLEGGQPRRAICTEGEENLKEGEHLVERVRPLDGVRGVLALGEGLGGSTADSCIGS